MRQLTAARKGENGGWHYVSLSSRGGYPIGYCDTHAPHATEEEARNCYNRWRRDGIELDVTLGAPSKCDRCENFTQTGARVRGDGYDQVTLCSAHLTVENAASALDAYGPAGNAWIS